MIKLLRKLFHQPEPLTDIERLLLFVAMRDRLEARLAGEEVEPLHDMLIRLRQPATAKRSRYA